MTKKKSHFSLSVKKINWLIEATIPILLVLLVGLFYYFSKEVHPYVYERVLSGGDLLAIAFTLSLSSLFEILGKEPHCNEDSNEAISIAILKWLGTVGMVVLAIMYAIAKIYTMENVIPEFKCELIPYRFTLLSHCSLVLCMFCIAFIYYGKSILEKYEL